MKTIVVFLLTFVLLCASAVSVSAANDAAHPLCAASSKPVSINYCVNSGLEWNYGSAYSDASHNAYLAGNSATAAVNASNIAITVTGEGTISFDYYMNSYNTMPELFLFYSFQGPLTPTNWSTNALNISTYQSFYGVQPWTHVEVPVDAGVLVNGSATLYIAFVKTTDSTNGVNVAAIANVCFDNGLKTVTLDAYDQSAGSVAVTANAAPVDLSAEHEFLSGTALTFSATPNAGYRFYGWVNADTGRLLTESASYSFNVVKDLPIKAVFGANGTYVAMRTGYSDGKYYTDAEGGVAQALADSLYGDQIIVLKDAVISGNLEIPVGRTLYVPYDETYDFSGTKGGDTSSSMLMATADRTYCRLTVNEGVTVTVNGKLLVGGVIGYPSQYYQGHTSGSHGRIVNNGTIEVRSGGVFDTYGFVEGSGTLTAASGAKVYEPFIVYDFAGGSNTAESFFNDQSPFRQYTLQNISCTLVLNGGCTLYGHCNLYANSEYNTVNSPIVSTTAENSASLMKLPAGASITRTVDPGKSVSGATSQEVAGYGADIGRVTYVFSGGAQFHSLAMEVYGLNVSTEDAYFPIPYCCKYDLTNGTYTFSAKQVLMPGAELVVAPDATLDVTSEFAVLDGLLQSDMSGKSYPASAALAGAGFSTNGKLIVNGRMIVENGAAFYGIVQSAAVGGRVIVETGANVAETQLQVGCVGHYDDNTSIVTTSGRVMIGGTLTTMVPGTAYVCTDITGWTLNGFLTDSYANTHAEENPTGDPEYPKPDTGSYHIYTTNTYTTTNQSMTGSFVGNNRELEVTVVSKTVYSASDASRVSVIGAVVDGANNMSFTVNATAAGKGYCWLVQYQLLGAAAPVTVTPVSGTYSISGINKDITIYVTAVKLGDVNEDGYIDSSDALKVLYFVTGKETASDLQKLSGDVNHDGYRDSSDALNILYHVTGKITDF